VFAFSAPSGAGVSARSNPRAFFEASPRDHITVWTPASAGSVLRRFGFKPVKMVSTGHHPERFPLLKKFPQPARGLLFRAAGLWSRLFALGDTFEVYAVKVGGSE
jgi:hypothetical protein